MAMLLCCKTACKTAVDGSRQAGTKTSYRVRERNLTALAVRLLLEYKNEGQLPVLKVDCCDCDHCMEVIVVRLRCQRA